MNEAERIKEIRTSISTLTHELETLKGHRGICSQCGEEGEFANWDEAHDLICSKCYGENERAKNMPKYIHLIGLKVVDLVLEPSHNPLQGIKLEGGYTIEVAYGHDGDAWIDVDHGPETEMVTLVIPKHHITDQRWPEKYKERIGENLLCACLESLNKGTEVVIVRLKELPEELLEEES